MKTNCKIFGMSLLAILFAIGLWGCGAGSLKPQETFTKLQPVDDLPEPTADDNLVVQINNVADIGTSHQNRAELFINGKRIRLNNEVYGSQQDYRYNLRLESGVYQIEAVYYAKAGKGEKEYKISTTDGKFRIYPDRRTVLIITLDKKLNGQLKQKKNYFTETQQPQPASSSSAAVLPGVQKSRSEANLASAEPQVFPIALVNETPPRQVATPASPQNKIALQINTVPSNARILVDGKFVGQSPLTVAVDRASHHVVQLSHPGYQDKVKVIDRQDLQEQAKYILAERLTAAK